MEINSGDSELDKKIAEWLSLDQVNMLFGVNCWIQGNVFAFCLLRMMRHIYNVFLAASSIRHFKS